LERLRVDSSEYDTFEECLREVGNALVSMRIKQVNRFVKAYLVREKKD
jgi:hypothetical protein